jgi:hypothetical protein
MTGYQIVAYENGSIDPDFSTPVGFDRIIKSWKPTRKAAENESARMQAEYNAITEIR